MLCSRCHENIPQGKEIQITGTIICQKCVLVVEKINKKETVARCWSCNRSILKGELIHESSRNDSKNFSKWFSFGTGSSEKLFQCDECHQKWRNDVKKRESWSKMEFSLLGLCVGISLKLITKLFFPEIDKRMNDNPKTFFTLLALLFIISVILGPIPEINRHEIRERKKKKEKVKK